MLGLDGTVNKCELLINIVMYNRPKMLTGLIAVGYFLLWWKYTDTMTAGRKAKPNPFCYLSGTW